MSTDVDTGVEWMRLHEGLVSTMAGLPRGAVIRLAVQRDSGGSGCIEVGADQDSDGIGVRVCGDAIPEEWDLVTSLVSDALRSRRWLSPADLPSGNAWMWISPVGADRRSSAAMAASQAITMMLLMSAASRIARLSVLPGWVEVNGSWHVLPSPFVETLNDALGSYVHRSGSGGTSQDQGKD